MTKTEYTEYEQRVKFYLGNLEAVSTGLCPGCAECGITEDAEEYAEEPWFSKAPCEICHGDAGDRVSWHGFDPETKQIMHGSCCTDCMYYLEYGRLDDSTMAEMK